VLYAGSKGLWKIADFGLTSEGTSHNLRSTKSGGGTTGYRAPELLGDRRHYNNKSDIWPIGCILHELTTGKKAFPDDLQVLIGNDFPLPVKILFDKAWEGRISDIIGATFQREPSNRPSAKSLVQTFSNFQKEAAADNLGPLNGSQIFVIVS
jgi:serine/threonine protein kinase